MHCVCELSSGNEAMQTRSSASALAEQVPGSHRREVQLQFVDPISFRGKVQPGWTVVNRPRSSSPSSSSTSVDTYFIEPGTGREFPSLEAVQRHLIGEEDDRRLTPSARGVFFNDNLRVYEGPRTNKNGRSLEHASKSFQLPRGWIVEEYPRKNSYRVDTYYVESKTEKRFRSLVSVERYLNESENSTEEQQLMLLEYHHINSKDFSLPDGWIIEDKPRRNSSQVDKIYVEPGTGKKFRSMAAVERYLKVVDSVSTVNPEELYLPGFQTEVIDPTPPEKVKWVLTGPSGNMFTAKMSGSDVSSSVKQKWSEAFVSLIQDHS